MLDVLMAVCIVIISSIVISLGFVIDKNNSLEKKLHFSLGKKKIGVAVIMFNISIITVYISLISLNTILSQRIPDGSIIGETDISNKTITDAFLKLDEYYPDFLKNRSLTLNIEGKIYQIPLEEISTRLDSTKTKRNIMGAEGVERISLNLGAIFAKKERRILPAFICDTAKITDKIAEIKNKVHRVPFDAHIILNGDNIEKKPEIYGLDLDTNRVVNRAITELEKGNLGPIELKNAYDGELITKRPRATMADIDKIDAVIGSSYTNIEYSENIHWIDNSVKAINSIFIPQKDVKGKYKATVFSFFECLEKDGFKLIEYSPGVNQVASTTYNALIKANLPIEDFEIVADITGAEYNPEIKKIKIMGNTVGLKYKNNLDTPLLIIAERKEDIVTVKVLGKKK